MKNSILSRLLVCATALLLGSIGSAHAAVVTGSYTGDGVDNRLINLGFQPDVVLVARNDSNNVMQIRFAGMTVCKDMGNVTNVTTGLDRIKSLTAAGFTVGTAAHVNSSAVLYHYLAISQVPGEITIGSYTGDGTDNRNITGLTFQPSMVMTMRDGATSVWRVAAMTGDNANYWDTVTGGANLIQALNADGFQLGTDDAVNSVGLTHYYIACKEVAGKFKTGSYVGTGANQTISGVGFSAAGLFMRRLPGTTSGGGRFGAVPLSTDLMLGVNNTTGPITAAITSITADGFTLGVGGSRANGNLITYPYFAFAPVAAPPPAPTVTNVSPASGPSSGGQKITITGTNFTGVTGVTVGGTAATNFTVVNATTITCGTPAHAAAAGQSVVVTTSGGPSTANSFYTYYAATVADFETASTGLPTGTTFVNSDGTWSLTGFLVDGSSAGLGSSPVAAPTPPSNKYLDSGYGVSRTASAGGTTVGAINAPTGKTFKAVALDIWPSKDAGNSIIPYTVLPNGVDGETGHNFLVKGFLNNVEVANATVADTLRFPPQSGAISGGHWHNLDLSTTAFATTSIDKLEFFLLTQSGNATDGPNIGTPLSTPNYIALDNLVYKDLTAAATTPDLTLTKTSASNFQQGGTATYTITVNNTGAGPTTASYTVSDTMPTGLTIIGTPVAAGWDFTGSTSTSLTGTRSTAIPAAGNTSFTFDVNIASNAPASITNTASASGGGESNTANNSGSVSKSVTQVAPDLTVTKIAQGGPFQQGGTIAYNITVTNGGNGPTTGTITVTDVIPTGLTVTSGIGTNWSVTTGSTVTATRSVALAAGASSVITLNANIGSNAPATITNTATVATPGESNSGNNGGTSIISVTQLSPDLTVTKVAQGSGFQQSGTVSYDITVTNGGNGPTTGTITVTDVIPTGLTVTSGSGTNWSVTTGSTVTATRTVALAAGASSVITLNANISSTAPASITNTATVATPGESNSGNNGGTSVISVAAPEIAVTGNSQNIVNGSSTLSASTTNHTDFGTAGGGSVVRTYTITNSGSAALNLTGTPKVVITGGTDFSVNSQPSTPVAASGGSTTFQVTFTPTGPGMRSAVVSIANDDSDENPFTFGVVGLSSNGVVVDDGGAGYSDSGLSPSSTPGYLGDQRELTGAGQSAQWTFTGLIPNSSYRVSATWQTKAGADDSASFSVYNGSVAVPNLLVQTNLNQTAAPNDFTLDAASWEDIGYCRVNASGTLVVTLARTNGIALADAVRVEAITGPEVQVFSSAVGVLAGSTVTAPPTSVGTPVVKSFSIQNPGTSALTIGSVSITGTNSADYAVTTTPSGSVAAAGSTTLDITFTPSATGLRTATVSFSTNDSDENPFTFTLSGTASPAPAEIAVSYNGNNVTDNSISVATLNGTDFGSVPVQGVTVDHVFTITNSGGVALTLGAVSAGGDFTVTQPTSPVAANGGTSTFTVSFNPSATGARNATITFSNSDSDETPFDFAIQGTGTGPQTFDLAGNPISNTPFDGGQTYIYSLITSEIAIEQPVTNVLTDGVSTVNFGTVEVLGTTALTFTIRNLDLSGTMNLGAITFDGANAGEFSVTTAPAATVGPNSFTTMVVRFKPLNDGARSAAIHIVNDDADENPFDIALTGTGKPVIGGTWPLGTPILTTTEPFDATGLTFDTDLGFVPTIPSGPITFIHSDGGITGQFNDLPDGGVVAMAIGGVIYYFQIDYGPNDITLTPFLPSGPPAWRWAAGPNTRNNLANFSAINVSAGTNNPGGRQGGMNWRGADGSLWMFGGYGYGETGGTSSFNGLNDLWQYNRTLGQWIWRSGSKTTSAPGVYGSITAEAAGNTPGARHTGTTWTDDSGNLWLFGGVSGAVRNNDLWRYRPSSGQWAWMKGSNTGGQAGTYGTLGTPAAANTPGSRQGSVGWFTPDGNLWLFGGTSNGSAYFNDLWRYNIASGNWTWMGGSNTTGASGIYGTKGIPNAANVPGARRDATGWVAANGDLWLFGGLGLPATGGGGNLNDLWRFTPGVPPANGQWTWMKGTNTTHSATVDPYGAVYGTQGTPNAANTPGGRSGSSGWSTVDGKFWLVGGFTQNGNMHSDVWIFDTTSNDWVWHLGDNTTNAVGVYGTLGVAAPGNKPGARFTPSTWVTLNGALWIFGGGGADYIGVTSTGKLSDLWSYSIPMPAGAPPLPAPEPYPSELLVNEDPVASDASAGTMAYVPVAGQLTGTDADHDIILFNSVGSTQSQGTLSLQANGQWVYTPAPGFIGQATFSFKASDYYGGESPVRTLLITVVTNPDDSDNDGIADSYENSHLGGTGADPLGDADLDGQSNYFEYLAGTSPVDAAQNLSTAPSIAAGASTSGAFKLDLNHVRPGVNYHLETSTDLDVWNRIGTFTFSVSGSATLEDPTPPTSQPQFYRVSLETSLLLP